MSKQWTRRSFVGSAAALGMAGAASANASTRYTVPGVIRAQDGKVPVTYWTAFGSGVNGEAQTKLVEDFNASQDDIEVTHVPYDNYEAIAQALITGLQTGDVPDIALFSQGWWFRFYLANALTDLNTLITDETDADDYNPTFLAEYQRHGGQWAIPFARSTPLLYYNNEMVEAAGLGGEVYETWSNIAEMGPDLIAGSDADLAFAFGSAAGYGAWYLQSAVWGFGGRYCDDDLNFMLTDEETVEAGEFMRTLVADGTAAAVTDPVQEFVTGVSAATFASTGSLQRIADSVDFDFRTAFVPAQGDDFACNTGGSGMSILNTGSEEQQQAAFRFIEFSTNTGNTTFWSQQTGYMPVRTSAVESDEMVAYFDENPNAKTAVEQTEHIRPEDPVIIMIPNGAQLLGEGWEQILVNDRPAEEVWAETTGILETEREPILDQLAEIEGD